MVIVRFKDVGRSRKSWDVTLSHVNDMTLHRAIKAKSALLSNEIDFEYDDEQNLGSIYVGGRHVGSYRVELDAR